MGASKQTVKTLGLLIIVLFFILFPLGQIPRWQLILYEDKVTLLPIDLVAGASLVLFPFINMPQVHRYFKSFFFVLLFSLIFSLTRYTFSQFLTGSMYLLRIVSYYSLLILSWNLLKVNALKRSTLQLLIIVSILAVAIFGWLQYVFFPDLTSLRFIGWDDHLFRLTGTFLDTGFTGIILVVGALILKAKFLRTRRTSYLVALVSLLITIAFTYSRAAYLSLIAGFFVATRRGLSLKISVVLLLCFALIIILLPRPRGEGVRLERTASINARLINYKQTFQIFRQNPLFGVGFNNICRERVKLFKIDPSSHSCAGSDSSLLLLLATSGLVGFVSFIYLAREIFRSVASGINKDIFFSTTLAILVNSLFINSLFYSWVMGLMAIIYATAIKEKKSL